MTDYDINDDYLPTFSPRDVMRRLARLELDRAIIMSRLQDIEPTPPPAPALDDDELDRLATNLLRLSLDGVPITGDQAASLASQIITEGIEFCQCAATAPDPDDDATPCEVCGRPNLYGSRHHTCGEYAMKMEREIADLRAHLAAPADRVVCEVTDKLVYECLDAIAIGSESGIRTVLNIAAAYWSAGADTQGEVK